MKTLLLFINITIITVSAYAQDVTLMWDHVTDPDLNHYSIYQADKIGNQSGTWEWIINIPGNENTVIVTVEDNKNYVWYATASDKTGNESGPSNIVELYDRTPPGKPTNMERRK